MELSVYGQDERWRTLVAGGSTTHTSSVQSVRGRHLLADQLPVVSLEEQASTDGRKITSSLAITCTDPVGVLADGPDAPLGWMGQQLIARAGFRQRDTELTVPLGQWRIDTPRVDAPVWVDYGDRMVKRGGLAQAAASDLLSLLEDDLPQLTGPLAGGTIQSEIVRLIEGRVPVVGTWWDSAAAARPVPPGQVYSDNRLTAICDLLALVGGVAWINRAGAFEPLPASRDGVDWVIPADATVAVVTAGGRDGLYNRAIVVGSAEDGAPLRALATETDGPFGANGTFGVVTRTFNNPLGKTQAALDATARTYLRQGIEGRAARCEISLTTPNWALDVMDRVQLTTPDGRTITGPVTHFTRSPEGMTMTVPVPYKEAWPDAVTI